VQFVDTEPLPFIHLSPVKPDLSAVIP
jgi:hypothetical protein